MIDEDDALEVLERLRASIVPGGGRAVAGAAVMRRDRRVTAFAAADPDGAATLPAPPAEAAWTLALTDWGRLEMVGDVRAAAEWLRRAGADSDDGGSPPARQG